MDNQTRCVRGARGLATALGIGLSSAEKLIRTGKVRVLREGRIVMIPLGEIDAYLATKMTEQHGAAR